jgi:hypothetical protein
MEILYLSVGMKFEIAKFEVREMNLNIYIGMVTVTLYLRDASFRVFLWILGLTRYQISFDPLVRLNFRFNQGISSKEYRYARNRAFDSPGKIFAVTLSGYGAK